MNMFDLSLKPFAKFDKEEFLQTCFSVDSLIRQAVDLIREHANEHTYVGHSGGKDSVVVRWLADFVNHRMPTIHTSKVDGPNAVHPLTMKFIYEQSAERPIIFAPLGQATSVWGLTQQIDGTRRCEAERSDGRSTMVVIDGMEIDRKDMPYKNDNGLFGNSFLYPIVDWSNMEVWATIYHYKIPYSEEYLVVDTK